MKLLMAEGVEGITTNDVAALAGVSIGTLYQYFADRNGLFQEIFHERFRVITEAVEQACAAHSNGPRENMAPALVQAFMGTAMHDLAVARAEHSVSDQALFREIVPPFRERQEKAITLMISGQRDRTSERMQAGVQVIFSTLAGNTRSLLDRNADSAEVRRSMKEVSSLIAGYLSDLSA